MLSVLDRHIRVWHVWLANGVAVAWFASMTIASQIALPKVALLRCPIGFCAGGYAPSDLRAMLSEIGSEGRAFLETELLPLDRLLPALLLVAFISTYVWFTRPGQPNTVVLTSGARLAFLGVPIAYCVADYAENWAIAKMLADFPDIADPLIRNASLLTAAKSQLVAASVGIAAALAIAALGGTYRSRKIR